MEIFLQMMEAAIFVAAVSLDGFVASFAYGTGRIRIPFSSVMIINIVCTTMLALSLALGELVRAYIPGALLKLICFGVLFLLGLVKCLDRLTKSFIRKRNAPFFLSVYANPERADADRSKFLSAREAVSLALALSLDGLAAGFGAALGSVNVLFVIGLSLIFNVVAVECGARLGNRLSQHISLDLSWLSGAVLIALAFFKL